MTKLILDRRQIEELIEHYLKNLERTNNPLLRERFLSYIRAFNFVIRNGKKV